MRVLRIRKNHQPPMQHMPTIRQEEPMNNYEQTLEPKAGCQWHDSQPVECPECEYIIDMHLENMVDADRERDL
jgi:hypothetical protein